MRRDSSKLSLNEISVTEIVQDMNSSSKLLQNLLGRRTVRTVPNAPEDDAMLCVFFVNKGSNVIMIVLKARNESTLRCQTAAGAMKFELVHGDDNVYDEGRGA